MNEEKERGDSKTENNAEGSSEINENKKIDSVNATD